MKLGVCVPYRNREEHLNKFIPRVGKHLKEHGIDFQMYFCHQVDDKLFNRGATKNIAAKHAFEDGCDYVVWHDIDMFCYVMLCSLLLCSVMLWYVLSCSVLMC